jgi:hypothetical protein
MDLNLVWAALLGALLAAIADWLFSGFLMRDRYLRTPETWRPGAQESGRIAAAMALSLLTAAAFVALAAKLHQTDARGALKLAAMIWAIGPLPLLLANHLFIRIDPLVTASHAAGWLAKLLLIAAAAAWLLP